MKSIQMIIAREPVLIDVKISNLANLGAKLERLKGQIKPLTDEAESIILDFCEKVVEVIPGASMEFDAKRKKWTYPGTVKGDKVNLFTEETGNLLHYVAFQTRASWNEEKLSVLAEKYGIPTDELKGCKVDCAPFPVMRDA